jgi:outer membrane receptor protein involved in Fe transport
MRKHAGVRVRALATGSMLALGLAAGFASGAAWAQAQSPDEVKKLPGNTGGPAATSTPPAEAIVVTGSRIVRKDYTANSPILTVDSSTFENTSTGAIEENLNKLPQFTPAVQNGFTSGDVQNTVVNTPGSANISLRGLGPNRNLVLVDGRRAMPSNGAMLVDVNSIPAAMIERVEVITGGASAVYGADAISGVANFILKHDYEGATFDAQWGETELGDGTEFRASGLLGGNFANDRGNATLAVERYTRGDAAQANRSFYTTGWRDPKTAGTDFWPVDTYYNPGFCFGAPTDNCPSQSVVNGIFSAAPAQVSTSALFMVNQGSGTVYTGMPQFGGNGIDDPNGAYRYTGGFSDRVVLRSPTPGLSQAFKVNEPLDQVVTPLQRYSAFGNAHYKLTDSITAFTQANLSQTHTTTFLAYSPAVNAWGVLIPHGAGAFPGSWVDANHNGIPDPGEAFAPGFGPGGAFGLNCTTLAAGCTNSEVYPTPPELNALLNSRPNPNAPWDLSRNLNFLPQRQTDNTNTTYQLTFGLDGKLPIRDWTWEVFGSHGRAEQQTLYKGFGSLEGYRALALSPNYGRNATIIGNSGADNPGNAGFAAGTVNCTSGLPFFGTGQITQDCIDAITANLQNQTAMEQNIVEADFQGEAFDDWAGPVQFALGASYRENNYYYIQDSLDSQTNALNSTIGLFPSNNTKGFINVSEGYGELMVPLLANMPFVKALTLETGFRYSDYNTAGGEDTWKVLADYTVNDWLRFRGGFNHATRAPNIGELFQAKSQTVAFATYADPCSINPSGVNPTWGPASANATQAQDALKICKALMQAAGASAYYGVPAGSQPLNTGFSLALPNNVGNPNLAPELADTWTAGVVVRSPLDNPLLKGMSLSVDWYSIGLKGLITAEAQDTVYQNCLDDTRNTAKDPNIPACLAIIRDKVNGAAQTVNTSFVNAGSFKTEGVDVQFDWSAKLSDLLLPAPGRVNVNVLANYTNTLTVSAAANTPSIEFAGTLGPNTGGLNAPAFKYRTLTTLGYANGPMSVSLRWQHLPSLAPIPPAAAGQLGAASHDEFDLFGNYMLTDTVSLRAGVDNLLNTQPEITGGTTAAPATGTTLPAVYDTLGRRYYVGVTLKY